MALRRWAPLAAMAFALSAAGPVERVQSLPPEAQAAALDVHYHRQTKESSCGAAALHSVMEYWGDKTVQQASIIKDHPPANEREGYSLGEMKRIAQSLGFKAFVVAGAEGFLSRQLGLGRPVIVPVTLEFGKQEAQALGLTAEEYEKIREKHGLRYNHFLVIIGRSKDFFVALDPAKGIYLVDKNSLETMRAPHKDAALLISL